MIVDLQISHLGAIDEVAVELGPGLTVVTGETGAGKTMLVTSLYALTGSKVSSALVRNTYDSAKVTASWSIPRPRLQTEIENLGGVVEEGEVLINRIISPGGKGKAFMGGQQIPVQKLANLTGDFITIHGQNDQLRLLDTQVQRSLLDQYAGEECAVALREYRTIYAQWKEAQQKYTYNIENAQALAIEKVQLTAIVTDLEEIDIQPGEWEELLTNIEGLLALAGEEERIVQAANLVNMESPHSITLQLSEAISIVQRSQHSQMQYIAIILEQAQDLITEAGADLARLVDNFSDSQGELEKLLSRQRSIKDLSKKYRCHANELITLAQGSAQRLAELDSPGVSLAELEKQLQDLIVQRDLQADILHQLREKAAEELEKYISTCLAELALLDTNFRVELHPQTCDITGRDAIIFMLERGNQTIPLHKCASGGELSRITLAMELAFASQEKSQTFVFDEIDTGVGGHTALSIGQKLQELAQQHQVLVVTHLPQVAAFGQQHLKIAKNQQGETQVKSLDREERINELARMLAGLADSASAREHATELLELAQSTAE